MHYHDHEQWQWHAPTGERRHKTIPPYSITYDPETFRFVVTREWGKAAKEFTTKRSAMRFVERWLKKVNNTKTESKKIPFKTKKMRAEERKRKAQEEIDRLEQEENIEFLKRIGAQIYEF